MLMAAVTTLTIAACAGTPTRESTGEYIDDTVITAKVKAKLVESSDVSAAAVSVETFKGTVQLSGFAQSENERRKAGELASAVDGVKRVTNDIRLR
jgi:osmotically-inducible protein OsmY